MLTLASSIYPPMDTNVHSQHTRHATQRVSLFPECMIVLRPLHVNTSTASNRKKETWQSPFTFDMTVFVSTQVGYLVENLEFVWKNKTGG